MVDIVEDVTGTQWAKCAAQLLETASETALSQHHPLLCISSYSEAATNERDARGRLSLGRATDGLSPAIFPYE